MNDKERILLMLLPFWDPQIPPVGLACLKSYLSRYGYGVKTVDANLELQFRELYDGYFEILLKIIPREKQGNIFNIGHQVLRNHMMAHINCTDKTTFYELVKVLVMKTFFVTINDDFVMQLDEILREFYRRFKPYFLEWLEKERPAVLGLSVYGDTFPASVIAFKWAKEMNPAIKTVMGGGIFADQLAPGSPDLEYFASYSKDFIDKIIIGEGEELFLRFLRGELKESQRIVGIGDVSGKPLDLNQVEIPDFSDFELHYYPHLAHYGSRSCPYQCKFCSETVNWGKWRKKDVGQTVGEFIELYRRYSYQLFLMTDSALNPIISDLARELINSGVSIYWDGFLRADPQVCNTENTLLWRRGGFYRAKLGLESGSQRVLDLMNKRITTTQSGDALVALAHAGIKTTTFWLFGFPGETDEDFRMTLDFLTRYKDFIYEADCNAFNYYLTGQANSEEWWQNNKRVRLYPQWARDLLITEVWVLNDEAQREAAYNRINRFVTHCDELGIPNPYSLKSVFRADERWKRLHKNAVPPLVDLKNKDIYVEENKLIKELIIPNQKNLEEEDFDL